MRTGTCEGDSSGRQGPSWVVLCSQPCPAWLEAARGTGSGGCVPPRCPTRPVASRNRCRATKPVGCQGWGTGQCQLRAEADQAGGSLPNLGTGMETLGTRPVSPLCPCKPKERLEQPLGTARPAMPLCIHRECLPGGPGTGWVTARAPTGPPRDTGGFFLTLTQDPKACPQPRVGQGGGMWGRASAPAPLCRV